MQRKHLAALWFFEYHVKKGILMSMTAVALNCTLKSVGESSTDAMIAVLKNALTKYDVVLTETIVRPI